MEQISADEYQRLLEYSKIIEKDGYGEKVLFTDDGYMVKIFRTKRMLSTAVLRPYAVRFAVNGRKLVAAGVPSVLVERIGYCRAARRHLVFYQPLPGQTLRQVLSESADLRDRISRFAHFLAELHRKGVYFRSIHFGNVLVSGDNAFALIDVADLTIRPSSLGPQWRARNFKHFFRYREDVDSLLAYGLADFLDDYLKAAQLPVATAEEFREKLNSVVPLFASTNQ